MKKISLLTILLSLIIFSACSSDDDNNIGNDTGNDGSTGSEGNYSIYFYEDYLYEVENNTVTSTIIIKSVGSDFNDAIYDFNSDGYIYASGSFLITYDYYLNGMVIGTDSEVLNLNSDTGIPYQDNQDGTITIYDGAAETTATYSGNELTIHFEDLNVDEDGDGTFYEQTWKLIKD